MSSSGPECERLVPNRKDGKRLRCRCSTTPQRAAARLYWASSRGGCGLVDLMGECCEPILLREQRLNSRTAGSDYVRFLKDFPAVLVRFAPGGALDLDPSGRWP